LGHVLTLRKKPSGLLCDDVEVIVADTVRD